MYKYITSLINIRTVPILALLTSAALWFGALGFEHLAGMKPCQMCLWQRFPHKVILGISALALIIRYAGKTNRWDKLFVWLIGFSFMFSVIVAFWHVGMEHSWWKGPGKFCNAHCGDYINVTPFFEAMKSKKELAKCTDIAWSMFGISMAGYNAIISAIAAAFSLTLGLKRPR